MSPPEIMQLMTSRPKAHASWSPCPLTFWARRAAWQSFHPASTPALLMETYDLQVDQYKQGDRSMGRWTDGPVVGWKADARTLAGWLVDDLMGWAVWISAGR